MAPEDQSCPPNKTQKGNSNARCTTLPYLTPNQAGPAPPCLELSPQVSLSERLPGSQGWNERARAGGAEKSNPYFTAPSRSPAPPCPTSRARRQPRQVAPPVPQSWRNHPKEPLCIPSLSPPDTSRGNGISPLGEIRQARTARPADRNEEERMKAVSEMQQKKDSSSGRDTSPPVPNSKPSSTSCHSALQRTLLRKCEGRAPRPSGGCSPGGLRPRRAEKECSAELGIRFLPGGAGLNPGSRSAHRDPPRRLWVGLPAGGGATRLPLGDSGSEYHSLGSDFTFPSPATRLGRGAGSGHTHREDPEGGRPRSLRLRGKVSGCFIFFLLEKVICTCLLVTCAKHSL